MVSTPLAALIPCEQPAEFKNRWASAARRADDLRIYTSGSILGGSSRPVLDVALGAIVRTSKPSATGSTLKWVEGMVESKIPPAEGHRAATYVVRYQDDTSEVWPLANVLKALTCENSYMQKGPNGVGAGVGARAGVGAGVAVAFPTTRVDWKFEATWSCANPLHICPRLKHARANLGSVADMSGPTVLAVLDRMVEAELITVQTDQGVTIKPTEAFSSMTKEALAGVTVAIVRSDATEPLFALATDVVLTGDPFRMEQKSLEAKAAARRQMWTKDRVAPLGTATRPTGPTGPTGPEASGVKRPLDAAPSAVSSRYSVPPAPKRQAGGNANNVIYYGNGLTKQVGSDRYCEICDKFFSCPTYTRTHIAKQHGNSTWKTLPPMSDVEVGRGRAGVLFLF